MKPDEPLRAKKQPKLPTLEESIRRNLSHITAVPLGNIEYRPVPGQHGFHVLFADRRPPATSHLEEENLRRLRMSDYSFVARKIANLKGTHVAVQYQKRPSEGDVVLITNRDDRLVLRCKDIAVLKTFLDAVRMHLASEGI